jgi:hypothetical protein
MERAGRGGELRGRRETIERRGGSKDRRTAEDGVVGGTDLQSAYRKIREGKATAIPGYNGGSIRLALETARLCHVLGDIRIRRAGRRKSNMLLY